MLKSKATSSPLWYTFHTAVKTSPWHRFFRVSTRRLQRWNGCIPVWNACKHSVLTEGLLCPWGRLRDNLQPVWAPFVSFGLLCWWDCFNSLRRLTYYPAAQAAAV